MELEQSGQKTYYDYSIHGPIYVEGRQVLVFLPTIKKEQTKNFSWLHKKIYTIFKLINELNFGIVH